jgi:thiosulfate reductase cytochrome b subunit
MSDVTLSPEIADAAPGRAPSAKRETRTVVIYRTRPWVRVWHWINALALFFLLVSGLQIFNAHPSLYWGQASSFQHPIVAMRAFPTPQGLRGVTFIGDKGFTTTGFLGASKYQGQLQSRGFPPWLTIPGQRDLAAGRRWHFFFAWMFAINGAIYFAYLLISRHLRGDLWPSAGELKQIPRSILDHILFRHPEGEAAAKFNILQKLAYIAVLFILLPLMILTGMTMSPGMDAAFPVLPWAFGGRQSARTIHFITAWSIVLFFAIHIFEVFAAGVFNEMRSIITGRFAIKLPVEPEPPVAEGSAP